MSLLLLVLFLIGQAHADGLVQSNPSGAKIYVNDVDFKLVTPSMIHDLKVGDTVKLEKSGCAPVAVTTTAVHIRQHRLNLTMTCQETTSSQVTLVTDPSGASILVDGNDTGLFTPSKLSLSPAAVVILKKQGYVDVKMSKFTKPITKITLKRLSGG